MDNNTLYTRIKTRFPLVFHLSLMLIIILVMALGAHLAMQIGTRHGSRSTVPDFSGIPFDQAQRMARKHDLKLHINDSLFVAAHEGGIILDQLPHGGVEVKPGRTIYVTINSYRQKMVPIPYVASRSLRQAKNMLEIAGLEIKELVYQNDMATNYVLGQQFEGREIVPGSRIEAEIGSGVVLTVGVETGSELTVTPQVVGFDLREAKSRIWELGLNVGRVEYDADINVLDRKDARVYVQSPSAECHAQLGSRVDLRLSLDTRKVERNMKEAEKQAREQAELRLKEEEMRADSLEKARMEGLLNPAAQTPAETPADEEGMFD